MARNKRNKRNKKSTKSQPKSKKAKLQKINKTRRKDLKAKLNKQVFKDNAKAAGVKSLDNRHDLKKIKAFLKGKTIPEKDNPNNTVKKEEIGTKIGRIKHTKKGKKWKPKQVEKQVKANWNKIKKGYKGPQRLSVRSKPTGLLKKYGKKDNGFKRSKFLSDVKANALRRYKSKGGIRANLGQNQNPDFDKIPDQYGRTLNNVRSSMSGIKRKTNIDSIGKQLTDSYKPPEGQTPVSYTHLTLPTKA